MKLSLPTLALAGLFFTTGCASIVSKSRWPVTLISTPTGAQVTVINRAGNEVYSGTTPAAVMLKSGSSFFAKESYKLTFAAPGYEPKTTMIEADINGWYFGNILFGGFIGLLIVDPATGAMYRITQQNVQVMLTQAQGFNMPDADPNSLQIVSISDIPTSHRYLLVPVK